VKAVNLIPADQRGGANRAGRTGGGVYVALGLLAVVVIAFAALTVTSKHVSDKQAEATRLETQAQAAQAKAGALASYKAFNAVTKTRSESVRTLAATRIDWGKALEQVSEVLPHDVSLTGLAASTLPGAATGGANVPLRSKLNDPAIEMTGCAPSQARVALLMARLRRLEGVERVSLSSSEKTDDTAGSSAATTDSGSAGGSSDGKCTAGSDQIPEFALVVFLTPVSAATSSGTSGPAAGTAAAAIQTINSTTSGS
jgi:Tfp pilus assembly protein PilN